MTATASALATKSPAPPAPLADALTSLLAELRHPDADPQTLTACAERAIQVATAAAAARERLNAVNIAALDDAEHAAHIVSIETEARREQRALAIARACRERAASVRDDAADRERRARYAEG